MKRRTEDKKRSNAVDGLLRLSCTITTDKSNLTSWVKIGYQKDIRNQPNTRSNACSGTEPQTDQSMKDIGITHLHMLQLQQENYKLKKLSNSHSLGLSSFDDEKVKFYTDLPNCKVFNAVLKSIKEDLTGEKILSKFYQILLTLMRLRINLPNQNLAYRFSMHPATVSRTFHNVLGLCIGTWFFCQCFGLKGDNYSKVCLCVLGNHFLNAL